jgi:hypothetical protein
MATGNYNLVRSQTSASVYLNSSAFRVVRWYKTDVSEQPIGPIFKDQEHGWFETNVSVLISGSRLQVQGPRRTLEDGTDR